MKNMKNLLLTALVLMSSTTWLEAWRCSGCPGEKGNNDQAFALCQQGHQYCAPCAAHNAHQCTQCIRQNPHNGNINIAVDNALQNSPRCHNCRELFNDTDHFAINPQPCHHRICVTCAHTLLQNRGYSQRTANYTNRRNAPQYNDGFVNHVRFGRHGRHRFEHRHRDVLHDNVVQEHSQQQHYIAAQCPVPGCDRAYDRATCNQIDTEYNNRAISFGQYMFSRLGSNKNERIMNGIALGGVAAFCAVMMYQLYQNEKKIRKQIANDTQSNHNHNKQKKYNKKKCRRRYTKIVR